MSLPDNLSLIAQSYEDVFDNKNLRSTLGPPFLPLLSTLGKVIEMAKFLAFDIKDLCISDLKISDEKDTDVVQEPLEDMSPRSLKENEKSTSDVLKSVYPDGDGNCD